MLSTCKNNEKEYALIKDTAKTVVGDDLVSKQKAGEGEGQAGHQDQGDHWSAAFNTLMVYGRI